MIRLNPHLQRRFERLTTRQQAAVIAYREALNAGMHWMDAVIAAIHAADMIGPEIGQC